MKLMLNTLIFISLLSIFVKTHAYLTNTYYIPEDNLHISSNSINFIFPDGSKLLRFYRPIDDECNEPNLHLKLLHQNGMLKNFDIQNLSIPRLNFCHNPSSSLNKSLQSDFINIKGLLQEEISNFFYILYYNILYL